MTVERSGTPPGGSEELSLGESIPKTAPKPMPGSGGTGIVTPGSSSTKALPTSLHPTSLSSSSSSSSSSSIERKSTTDSGDSVKAVWGKCIPRNHLYFHKNLTVESAKALLKDAPSGAWLQYPNPATPNGPTPAISYKNKAGEICSLDFFSVKTVKEVIGDGLDLEQAVIVREDERIEPQKEIPVRPEDVFQEPGKFAIMNLKDQPVGAWLIHLSTEPGKYTILEKKAENYSRAIGQISVTDAAITKLPLDPAKQLKPPKTS